MTPNHRETNQKSECHVEIVLSQIPYNCLEEEEEEEEEVHGKNLGRTCANILVP